jgi:hypothetical protein
MIGQQSGKGSSQSSGNTLPDASATVGIGGRTSGEAGSTPTHETMAETGGSGLARNQAGQPQASDKDAARSRQDGKAGKADSAMRSGARGFQDTRSYQAGGTGTGLGTPETGANQVPGDLDRQQEK